MAVVQPTGARTTLVAVFEDRAAAQKAVDELETAGFASESIGYAIRGAEVDARGMITDEQGAKDRRGALAGMATGAGLGAVLGAAAAMLVPGVGPVVAAGVLTTAFGGAIAGTAIGGIFGAMTGLGASEEEARFYEREFNSGRALVAVRTGARCSLAAQILRRHGGYDLHNRPVADVPTAGVFSQP